MQSNWQKEFIIGATRCIPAIHAPIEKTPKIHDISILFEARRRKQKVRNARMRVLFDHQAFTLQSHGGVSHYFSSLIDGLSSVSGIAVEIGLKNSSNLHLNDTEFFRRRLPNVQYRATSRDGTSRWERLRSRILRSQRTDESLVARRMIRTGGYDVFHPTYYSDYWLSENITAPVVVTLFDMVHELFAETLGLESIVQVGKHRLQGRVDKWIAISETSKRDAVAVLGLDPNAIEVVHLAPFADNGKIDPNVSLPDEYILYTGSRWAYKNFPLFARAFAKLAASRHNIHLVVAGGGPFSLIERSYLRDLGIEPRVLKVDGGDAIMNATLAKASVFVYPSLYEGFGIPILDAWRFGVPVACARNPAFVEIAEDAAFFFDGKDLRGMIDAIEQALDNKTLADRYKNEGSARLNKFSSKRMVEKTISVYTSLG